MEFINNYITEHINSEITNRINKYIHIEENEEMYIQKLNKKVVYYKRNDLTHLQKLINYYLKHENERERVVMDCFEYFKDKYNYSVFV